MKSVKIALACLLALMTLLSLIPTAVLPAAADTTPAFEAELFPDGISAPSIYLEVIGNSGEDNGRFCLWYDFPSEIANAGEAYRNLLYDDGSYYCFDKFKEQYGVDDWYFYLQVDMKVDNGDWSYTESWDRNEDVYKWYGWPEYYSIGERIENVIAQETTLYADTLHDHGEEGHPLHNAITSAITGWGEPVYHYDLDTHTVCVRARVLVKYYTDDYENVYFITGAWSSVASVGKNGTQTAPAKPTSIPVPVINDFHIEEPEDGMGYPELKWYLGNVPAYDDLALYWEINNDWWDGLHQEGLIRVNNGDWMNLDMWGYGISAGGSSMWNNEHLTPGCHVEAKFRVGCEELGYSAWSPVYTAGAEMYCDHPTWGAWYPCPEDNEKCERACTVCGHKDTKWHYSDTSVVLVQPTCTTEGTREYTCEDCGYKWTASIPTGDAHVFGAWETKDDESCTRTCTLCGKETETKYHYFVADASRSVEPTCGAAGHTTWVCADCHFEKTEELPQLPEHRWGLTGNEQSFWHSVGVDKPHERVCPDCGLVETGAHTWNSGTVTKKATCAEEGVKTFSCTVCDATYTEPVAKTTLHDYDKKWIMDEGGHWYECKVCHDKISYAFHTPGPEATETTPQVCTVCNYIIHPVIKHEHEITTGWTYDETGHWHYCTGCGEKSSFAAHTFGNDCDTTCDICGYVRTVTHVPGTAWGCDATNHWHTCEKCGIILETAPHVPGPAATETTAQTCTVCGQVLQPTLDHVHVWDDKYTYNDEGHWYACRGCSETKGFEAHVYSNACDPTCNLCGAVRTTAHTEGTTWTSDGTNHWHVCTICGEIMNIAAHEFDNACDPICNICGFERQITHDFETTWKGDTTGHWHACSICGTKSDVASHAFDDDYDPDCNVCGYIRTIEHRFSEKWKYNDTQHWHVCTDCDAQSDKADHIFDNACDPTCNVCGYTRQITHKFEDKWTSDDTDHWHVCTICAAILDKAPPTPGEPATATTAQTCTVCGHVIAEATGEYQSNDDGHWSTGNGTPGSGDFAQHTYDSEGVCTTCGHLKPKPEDNTTAESSEPVTEAPTEAKTEAPTEVPTEAKTEAPTEKGTEASTEDTGKIGKKKCWLCGFCPCPLGICIFIWLLILIIIIVVIILLLTRKKKCPNCGEKVGKKDEKCPHCGADLKENKQKTENDPRNESK